MIDIKYYFLWRDVFFSYPEIYDQLYFSGCDTDYYQY